MRDPYLYPDADVLINKDNIKDIKLSNNYFYVRLHD